MPLWLDLLRTPMAAPETPALRRMRRTWQLLCFSVALVTIGFRPLHAAIGAAAPALVAALLAATALYTWLYVARKNAADAAHLDRLGEAR